MMLSRPHHHRHVRSRLGRPAVAFAALSLLCACSSPALQAPSPSVPLAATFSNAGPAAAAGAALDEAWWDGFRDPVLAGLVREALSANQDVAIAMQRVAQARAGAAAQASRL